MRFAAAKALALFRAPAISPALIERLSDADEHIFVSLEAAASLVKLGREEGWAYLQQSIKSPFAANRLETVIVLAELRQQPQARTTLLSVLANRTELADVRAGAAWALGEHRDAAALTALVGVFTDSEESIRVEAARALAKIAPQASSDVLAAFASATDQTRPGVAWALAHAGTASIGHLLPTLTSEDARQWGTYIIGTQGRERFINEIEHLKKADPEVYFAVTVLWKILSNWVFDLKEYG